MVSRVLEKENPLACEVNHRIDPQNVQLSIDQLLVNVLPGLEDEKDKINKIIEEGL